MKLSTREDIEAPIETVHAAVTDFAAIERQLKKRGVDIGHDPATPLAGVGRRWQARASWRGREYRIVSELVSIDEARGYAIMSTTGGVECRTVVELIAQSKTRTRILVSLDLRPTTLSSRLLIQSLRLAKGRLSHRLESRVSDFARRVENGTA